MKKILIVEDDKDISIELKALLENSGYEASILTDFKNASDEILRNEPDLLLLDINIPYMNGDVVKKFETKDRCSGYYGYKQGFRGGRGIINELWSRRLHYKAV